MRQRLTVRISVAAALVAAALIAAMLVVNAAIADYRASSRTAVASERLVGQANALESLVVDAERSVRGFAVTGDERFLQPWRQAVRRFPDEAQALVDASGEETEALAERIHQDGQSYLDDDTRPLVAAVRANGDASASPVTAAEGKRRVDGLRVTFGRLVQAAEAASTASIASARDKGDRAKWITIGSIAGIVVLLGALAVYLSRSISRPLRRTAAAADAVGAGRLDVRIDDGRSDEIGQLATAFNTMAASLELNATELDQQHAELESQNQELESQAVEMEAQTVELETAQLQLSERNDELEHASASLREANARVRRYAEVSDRFAFHPELGARAQTALEAVAELVGAEVGTLYVALDARGGALSLLAARGVAAEAIGERLPAGQDLPGRALAERRALTTTHPDVGLRLRAYGSDVAIRHELHVPLMHGERSLGVLSVGRVGDAPFSPGDIETAEHLAEMAAVALDNALVTRRARELADINRAVLDATRDGIRLVDLEGHTMLTNPAMERIAGQALADHDSFDTATLDPHAEAVDELEVPASGHWFHRYTAPVRTAGGELVGRIFVLRDTTEQHHAERLKDELMATVSHELRTPLAAILGFTELLLTRDFAPQERDRHTRTVHEQAKRLSDLIGDFLDLQRFEQRTVELSRDAVDIAALLREQATLYGAQSGAHPIRLRVPDGPLTTLGDGPTLARAFGNLLSNAIKYSPAGGAVSVDATRHDDSITVAINDSGIGIPADARERIFDRFYRVDSSATRTIGGTGLGLSLVREIVREHGGSVAVDSVEGHGSTFRVTLPAADPQPR